ncbi:MAG TPA: spermidine/putrescine ABC transporter permease [Lachnospiraceae bacterium]|nr:spermidine/putrescine ABC transporter permease [Lachnospiraceae bacterium]
MRKLIKNGYLGLMLFFFYLPIIYTVVFSFNESKSLSSFTGFSLKWYEKMIHSHDMLSSVFYTVAIALLATAVSTVAGTVTAIGLSRSGKKLRGIVSQVNDLPIMNPDIVTAIGLLMFFSTISVKKGFLTMLLAHIMFCIPYVMLSVMPKLRSLDPNLLDAALDLGCTPMKAVTKVIVPQITSGIVTGALISFTMSFDDFVISYFVTGNGVNNISIIVYTMAKRINPSINALSAVIIVLITATLLVANLLPILHEKIYKQKGI